MTDKTITRRSAKFRAAIKESGGRQLSVPISAAAAQALDAIRRRDAIEVRETSTYRWCACHCCDCGAIGPESRVRDIAPHGAPHSERDRAAAVAEWNRRVA